MKKLIYTVFATAFSLTLNAQEIWLEAGLKGGPGLSFLYNKNIADDDTHNYLLTPMYGFGAKFAVNFGPNHGFTVEGLYNQSGQKFDYNIAGSTTDFRNEINWKSMDAYLLYRHTSRGVFVELGPMYSFIRSVDQTDNGGADLPDVSNFYAENYLAGVFGFGGLLFQAETISGGLGVRLHYGFGDFVSEEGVKAGYPNPNKSSTYTAEETTAPVFAQLLFEVNFGIGHFAKTGCSKRMTFYGAGRR